MFIASIMGISAGIYATSVLNPANNYFIFMAFFGIIGIGAANLVLLVLYEVYSWLNLSPPANEEKP
jgi:hypothetical protein